MINKKITTLDQLGLISNKFKKKGKNVVLCHGMFDLIHLGHIRYFQEAKEEGDILIVTLTADKFCRKGPGRPIFSENLRAESLAALEIIDYIAICPHPTGIEAIKIIKPNIYAKGKEYEIESDDITGMIAEERIAVELYKGQIFYTDNLVLSSSNLLNRNFDIFTPEVKEYINNLKSNFTLSEIIESLNNVKKSKILVIGDAIIDRYTYVKTLGQSGKGIHFSVLKDYSVDYPGGSLAVANHIGAFSDDVTLLTGLGSKEKFDNYESYIRSNLISNVTPKIVYLNDARTIVKERFIDKDMNKFFEIYHTIDGQCPNSKENLELVNWLDSNLQNFDIVVVPDYGEGLITHSMSKIISKKSKFLAINTQLNSGNRGYHVVNRYNSANFISLNEPELRLARHDKHGSISELSKATAKLLSADFISITQGPRGLDTYCKADDKSFKVPALSSSVVDRVGAGDAFLSISAICLGSDLKPEISIFLGATAAAMDVQIIGNESTINRVDLIKYVTALLK